MDRKYKPSGKHRNSRERQLQLGVISATNTISIVPNNQGEETNLVYPAPPHYSRPSFRNGRWHFVEEFQAGKLAFREKGFTLFSGGEQTAANRTGYKKLTPGEVPTKFGTFQTFQTGLAGRGVYLCQIEENLPFKQLAFVPLLNAYCELRDGIDVRKFDTNFHAKESSIFGPESHHTVVQKNESSHLLNSDLEDFELSLSPLRLSSTREQSSSPRCPVRRFETETVSERKVPGGQRDPTKKKGLTINLKLEVSEADGYWSCKEGDD